MSTLSELGDYLEAEVHTVSQATNLFLGSRPDTPDTVLVIYEYAGSSPEYTQESFRPSAESVQIQVVARAIDYEEAKALASEVWSVLACVTNTDLSGTHYRSIRPNASPALLGRDANDRNLVYFNATVEKEVSLGT